MDRPKGSVAPPEGERVVAPGELLFRVAI